MDKNQAMQIMEEGRGCSESVLLAITQAHGIENEIIPKIASCFAGGIGNSGSVCGAVSGAIMAIGLIVEEGETFEDYLNKLSIGNEFRKRFEAEMGTIYCRELTGYDMTTSERTYAYMKSEVPQKVCFPAVGHAYNIAMDMMKNLTNKDRS